MYTVGQEITTRYTNPPVTQQYAIGAFVDITNEDTGELLAEFRVISTDDTTIHGVITSVVGND